MKIHSKLTVTIIRIILFLLALLIAGSLLSLWFGLGYFFLFESIRRIIIAVPQLYISFLRLVVSEERANEEKNLLEKKNIHVIYIWRAIVACIWLILTFLVFRFANVRLIDIF